MTDAKQIVANGYDEIAEHYSRWTSGSTLRLRQLDAFSSLLPAGSRILDLGCGAGMPVAAFLLDRGHRLTGIDGSARQIALACENEPRASFIVGDMTDIEMEPESVDAVTAFYSITHVPRDQHLVLFRNIGSWLKPGGLFLSSLGYTDTPSWLGPWLGTTMYFSHFDAPTNIRLLKDAGFDIEYAEVIGETENDETINFLWVIGRKPVLNSEPGDASRTAPDTGGDAPSA